MQRNQPSIRTPDWRFVHADGHDIERTTFGCDVGCDTLAEDVLFQSDPLNVNARLLCELIGIALHPNHVAVIHSGDCDCFCKSCG